MTILYGRAIKPPGYVQPSKAPDPNPPKYEYGYKISDEKGSGQGKQEQRDGIYALGRYYVQQKNANQEVQYFADDWGYHPVVEYSSVGPHSRSTAKFALGAESVQQLKNKENNLPQLQGIFNGNERLDTISTVPSSQNKAQQTIPQPQDQIFTVQLQQESHGPQQQKQEENTNPLPQEELAGPADQQGLGQTVLLEGEFQQQPLEGRISESQVDNEERTVLGEGQSSSLAQHQVQNSNENLPQYSKLEVEEDQQFIEQNQKSQQIGQEISQNQFNQSEEGQIQQVLLKHEEPIQQLIFPQQQQTVYQQSQQESSQVNNHNAISEKTDIDKTLYVQLLPQQGNFIQQVQFLSGSDIVGNQGALNYEQNQDEFQGDQYESTILFENSKKSVDQLIANEQYQNDNYENKFGSKTTTKDEAGTSNKLIEHTKNLVTGQDVLNINQAIIEEHINAEPTPQTISDYDSSRIVSENTITNILINHSDSSYSTSATAPITEASLHEQPIVVADIEENTTQTTAKSALTPQGKYHSSISTTPLTISKDLDLNSSPTVLVTPRPVSNTILAPITAGVQLQNIDLQSENEKNFGQEQYGVEVQKSLPYYLGKFEYPQSVLNEQQVIFNSTVNETNTAELRATENIELGKTLLFFPGQNVPKHEIQQLPQFAYNQQFTEVNNDITVQQLPSTEIKENFIELDQQPAQGYQHHVVLQHTGAASNYGKPPTEITKIIHRPYPVKVPYEVPYPVVKQVHVPFTVQKIIEKPIHLTKYIEKPVPVPQPYPVEKIVEKPIHVPIQVTKYIDRPYPVEVRIPYPQPYPVEKVVQKIVKQPYPVEVRIPVPVEKIVEKKVPVPHYVEKPVEKIIEKPVPHYIDRPYPVEVKVPIPQPYVVHVEVPKIYPQINKVLQKPYGTAVASQASNIQAYTIPSTVNIPQNLQFGFPLHINAQSGYLNKKSEQQAQQSQQQQTYIYANPYAYAPQINHYLSPKQELAISNGYLPIAQNNNKYFPPKKDCGQQNAETSLRNLYFTIKPDNYIGLLPPKISNSQFNFVRKLRTARSNFDEKNIRMEYGFMPPLIPSLEIDEQGNPIERNEK
ncbi:uncharacterized protein LOC108906040 [Anoplophora glabripennis]|uniref:uncharacterized protein LOC108906040 n=1 Tax=Anoplophora glabripennis TaxID=217634 RepID=UPI000874E340|nr:uncharacterized protein LOC108906040 [Anoplophora glabripennis]